LQPFYNFPKLRPEPGHRPRPHNSFRSPGIPSYRNRYNRSGIDRFLRHRPKM